MAVRFSKFGSSPIIKLDLLPFEKLLDNKVRIINLLWETRRFIFIIPLKFSWSDQIVAFGKPESISGHSKKTWAERSMV